NLSIAGLFYYLLPASQHFKTYPIKLNRFKNSFRQNLADPKLRVLFLQGFILIGCFVSVFNYLSYRLIQAPFELSHVWIGVISITYLAGIYSSPRAAHWGRHYGKFRILPAMILMMLVGLGWWRFNRLFMVFTGLRIFTFFFFVSISPP